MDNDKLWKFVSLANAVCSKCGDDNPYLDNSDPNFLCRQCRTRQQAWGGNDEKAASAVDGTLVEVDTFIKQLLHKFGPATKRTFRNGDQYDNYDNIEYRVINIPLHQAKAIYRSLRDKFGVDISDGGSTGEWSIPAGLKPSDPNADDIMIFYHYDNSHIGAEYDVRVSLHFKKEKWQGYQ